MRKRFALALLTAMLALAGCGVKPVFGVSTNEDNTISITAEKAVKDSVGLGYLTVGENETVVIEPSFEGGGELRIRMMAGLLGADDFADEPTWEVSFSGTEPIEQEIAPGEYTVGVTVLEKVTGTALVRTQRNENIVESADAADDSADDVADETVDDSYYSGVTAMGKKDVEAFAAQIRQAYLDGDWAFISTRIRYPIRMYPDVEVNNAEEFLAYMSGKTVHESDRAKMEEESCRDMFFNGQGICLGSGQAWIIDVHYMEDVEPLLQIIALSGIVEDGQ